MKYVMCLILRSEFSFLAKGKRNRGRPMKRWRDALE